MKNQKSKIKYISNVSGFQYFYICIFIFTFLSGCGDNIIKKPLKVCPGKANVTESLAALQTQTENMVPLYTNKGEFSLEVYENEKIQKHHFQIRHLLLKPPSEIFLQAKTGIIDKAMVLGSNADEFWLHINPMNSYWWGKWSDQDNDAEIMINPKTMLEALGIYHPSSFSSLPSSDDTIDWTLTNEGPYDILTMKENGTINKKLYIYCCDYRVRKIEYFNKYGDAIVLAKLDDYTEVSPGFSIPFSIEINSLTGNIEETFNLEIALETINLATESRANYKIVRPKTPSVDNIFQIIDGDWFEQ